MKTKVVEHIAGNAAVALQKALGEADELRHRYPNLFADRTSPGLGSDMDCLTHKLEEALKLVELLAADKPPQDAPKQ